jgi:hypothetical protein
MAIEKFERCKSPELMQVGDTEIQNHIYRIRNKEELPQWWKECTTYGDKADFRGIELLTVSHKILSSTLLARLTPYVNELVGHCLCDSNVNG